MQMDWSKRHFGLLAILAVALALGALAHTYRFDRLLSAERSSLLALDRTIGSLEVSLADVGGAQAGYLSTGQEPEVWTRRSSDVLGHLETALTGLRNSTSSAEARAGYDMATTALANLGALD